MGSGSHVPDITVITPTIRWGGLDIWKTSLQRQTFKNFEAFLLDEQFDARHADVSQYFAKDDRLHHVRPPQKDPDKFFNLSKSLNVGLRLARGSLVVFFQDYIWLPEDALAKFWTRSQEVGDALITGVGHKYAPLAPMLNPKGHLSVFTRDGGVAKHEPGDCPEAATRKPVTIVEPDPRMALRGWCLGNPAQYETNWAAASKKALNQIGGFDEDFDAGYAYDNVNLAERAQLAGYYIWLDPENPSYSLSHELLFGKHDLKAAAPRNTELWRKKNQELYS